MAKRTDRGAFCRFGNVTAILRSFTQEIRGAAAFGWMTIGTAEGPAQRMPEDEARSESASASLASMAGAERPRDTNRSTAKSIALLWYETTT